MASNKQNDQQMLAAAFRRLVNQLEVLNIPDSAIEDVQLEIDRIGFLAALYPPKQTSSFSLLDQIDWVLGVMAPLSIQAHLRFDPSYDLQVSDDVVGIRRKLFKALTDLVEEHQEVNIALTMNNASQVSIQVESPATSSIHIIKVDNVTRSPIRPIFSNIKALVLCDSSEERQTIESRLQGLGVQCVDQLAHEPVDVCIVTDEQSSAFLSIKPMLHEHTILLLNNRQLHTNESWIPVSGPLTQHSLRIALASTATQEDHHSDRVLIVDDNLSNTQLLQTQLNQLGLPVDVAESGEQAINAVEKNNYRLIFMDLQMPVMTGAETAQKLRELDYQGPIYGLTAHASVSERAECLESGMQDVLVKPVRLERLEVIVQQPLPYSKPSANKPMAAPRRQPPVFDPELALEVANHRPDVAKEMFELLIDTLPSDLAEMNDARDDIKSLKKTSHALLGALRFCGAPRLTSVVEQLEQAINAKETASIGLLLDQINSEAAALLAFYNQKRQSKTDLFESLGRASAT